MNVDAESDGADIGSSDSEGEFTTGMTGSGDENNSEFMVTENGASTPTTSSKVPEAPEVLNSSSTSITSRLVGVVKYSIGLGGAPAAAASPGVENPTVVTAIATEGDSLKGPAQTEGASQPPHNLKKRQASSDTSPTVTKPPNKSNKNRSRTSSMNTRGNRKPKNVGSNV